MPHRLELGGLTALAEEEYKRVRSGSRSCGWWATRSSTTAVGEKGRRARAAAEGGLEEVRNPAEKGFEHTCGRTRSAPTATAPRRRGRRARRSLVDHAVESGVVEKAEEDAEWKREEGIAGDFGSAPMWKEIEQEEAKREAEAKKLREEYGARY